MMKRITAPSSQSEKVNPSVNLPDFPEDSVPSCSSALNFHTHFDNA